MADIKKKKNTKIPHYEKKKKGERKGMKVFVLHTQCN